ncbi:MAG: Beta-lactamase class A-like protein [candidate division CPR2 bacterium GW2011_GWD2_39_7]|nr:MAG: Beta-lactamase class A-like protein [candidate division CPR2 bacterium GW2011_GWD2_39_7]
MGGISLLAHSYFVMPVTARNLENKIKQLVDKEVESGNVNTASVFFRDIKSGNQININPKEKFYPASLHKIPVMIAYFKLARTDPKILDKKIMVSFEEDTNSVQGIKPKDYAKNGRTYSVQELIEKMIKHSDNNAAYALTYNIDQNLLDQTFKDLKIPYPTSEVADYISASDFSYFFRVLYNATYLKRDLSERALNILSEVDYKEGLVAGVPKDVPVAHKYGLGGNIDRSNSVYNELHDCGIVYHPREPYFLCVMTKSISDTPIIESTIKSISSEVYKEVERAANVSP